MEEENFYFHFNLNCIVYYNFSVIKDDKLVKEISGVCYCDNNDFVSELAYYIINKDLNVVGGEYFNEYIDNDNIFY